MNRIIKNTLALLSGKERRTLFLFITANVIISIIDIASLAVLVLLISGYTQGVSPGRLSFISAWLVHGNYLPLIFCFLIFFILKNMTAYLIGQAQYRFVYNVASGISSANLLRYLQGSYMEYVNTDSSVNLRKIGQQPIEFCHYILMGLQQIFTEIILVLLTLSAVIWLNAKLFLLLFIVLLPAVLLLARQFRKRLKAVRIHIKTVGEKALQYLKETLSGYVESNIYDKHPFFVNRYMEHQHRLNNHLAELQILQKLPSRFIEIFAVLGLFILMTVNKLSGNGNIVSLVTVGAFIAAAYKIIPGIVKTLNISGQIRAYEFSLYGLMPEKDKENMHPLPPPAIQSVKFNNVRFAHPESNTGLNGFNLNLRPGDFLGITGASGKGKTTILNLLFGFLEPDAGEIQFNDKSTDAAARKGYWKNIAYVKQQSFVIHESILKNITLDDKDHNEERLASALQACGLQELVRKFPEGTGKIIAENGKNISGGQCQRIAIARALYKNAGLLILDEPFNELDEASERRILQYLRELSQKGKMIVLITHNKQSLSFCNTILSLDDNR
ncbi:MAG TPA: ABC transporter ATP-binding protein [Chitinophagaceae bacterium]